MFDRYVVSQTTRSWKRRALIIASIALHVIGGTVLVIWSFFHVEEIVPPTLALTVFNAPPPPPPPPLGAKKRPASEHKTTPVEHKPVTQPTEIPKIVQPTEKQPEKQPETDEPEGDPQGDPNGKKGGTGIPGVPGVEGGTGTGPGGVGIGTGKNTPPPPKMVPQFMLDAQRVSAPDPHLPEWFRQAHPQQVVKGMYKICVRNDGHVSDVYVLTSIQGMDQTIIDQIKSSWVYKPQPLPLCAPRIFMFKIN
jgi:hypothetical protein